MFRFLAWLALLLLGWLFARSFARSVLGSARGDPSAFRRDRARGPARPAEELVRDRICQTYLPRSRAIRHVDRDGGEHFFCSDACRDKHVARGESETGPAA